MNIVKEELIEKLSDLEHDSWARWMKYLFNVSTKLLDGSVLIPKESVHRWTRQMNTEYENLSEEEKESDRKEVRVVIDLLKKEGVL